MKDSHSVARLKDKCIICGAYSRLYSKLPNGSKGFLVASKSGMYEPNITEVFAGSKLAVYSRNMQFSTENWN
jgi:hypothetical protein